MATPMEKKSTINEIQKRFDKDVERFSNLETGQQATMDAPITLELTTAAAAASNPLAKRLLDIGCGAGNNTLRLLQRISPMDCDLVDLSMPMLERAQQRISSVNKGRVRIFHEDFRTADLPQNHYDVVLAAQVFHHLRDDQDWESTFAKLYSIIAPGGSVWITDLVTHENLKVQELMWQRYGDYLVGVGGQAYKEKAFAYIDKEDTPRPVTYQIDLLKKVGFTQVDLLHKNSCFVAYGAFKERKD